MFQVYFDSISYGGDARPNPEEYPEHPDSPLHFYTVTLAFPDPNYSGDPMRVTLEITTFSLSLDEARVEAIRQLKAWISDLSEAIEEAERDFSLQ